MTRTELRDEIHRLKAEVENSSRINRELLVLCNQQASRVRNLKDEVERLRKAVMHSPAAQLKLKELEGKTTYEEINAAKDGKPSV
jgi:uncharacterized small protein (DUF1192 family)